MPNQDDPKHKPTAATADSGTNEKNGEKHDDAAWEVNSDYQRYLLRPHLGSTFYTGGHTHNAEFVASQGQDVDTDTFTLNEVYKNRRNKKELVETETELFVKQSNDDDRYGIIVDTNAKHVVKHVPKMVDGIDVEPIQDTTLGFNTNWRNGVQQVYLSQALRGGQNTNLALTHNQNGTVLFIGGTSNPWEYIDANGKLRGYKDDFGNLRLLRWDIQGELPDDSTGISKVELKLGAYNEHPREKGGNTAENGVITTLGAGVAVRNDGIASIVYASADFNQTDTDNFYSILNVIEKKSFEVSAVAIFAHPGSTFFTDVVLKATCEKEVTLNYLAPEPQQLAKSSNKVYVEAHYNANHELGIGVGVEHSQEKKPGHSKMQLGGKVFYDQKQGKSEGGAIIEIKWGWPGDTSYNLNKDTREQKPQLPATELKDLTPAVETGLASVDKQGPFKDSLLDRYHAAVKDGNSVQADRLANEFAQSPEGQRMAQQGDRLLAQQQAQEQQLTQARTLQGPVMRI